MKATHEKLPSAVDAHRLVLEGAADEFRNIIDALENHPDPMVQALSSRIRKWIGTGR